MSDYLQTQAAEWDRYTRHYTGRESLSGPGSTLEFTAPLREWLPGMLERHRIRSILDAGCGDFTWLSTVDLTGVEYVGWDHQLDIIAHNAIRYPDQRFECVNLLTVDTYPTVDLVIARDVFIHLPNEHVAAVLNRIWSSGSHYLLATNFPGADNFTDQPFDRDDFWYRPTDLEAPPFNLTGRVESLPEPGREPGREMLLCEL